ncbi:UDP-N-acetylmuramate--L-alanine ligase [Terasakiella sp. A23]|uniref:UDP-N-acetylmuramate--L-alanine ligase n=1 Tax=Terasakiella sp. FCG-A23 TaxID=3080561 RepID=UPI0029543073|nr:UDP-N-acetylmuramate--L-alanine ligase [Terasakiella sp. A23]MDV7340034.1 UDP-N-acetylmuramate--L-alanine ligase [Terasakiella sp. A23]
MKSLPLSIGTIHFVGIGGIGMSGIAEILHNLGYKVQGSDMADNANVQRLRGLGIDVFVGHAEENVTNAQVVVISSAVKPDNPEVVAARHNLTPVVRRAEMLAELMRLKASIAVAGTHGKTTTTTIVATLLDAADFDPTVINGGIINAYGTNARLGEGEWLVAEADESDGTFIKIPAACAVVTNIDPEHLDHYGDFDTLRAAFDTFVQNIPFYGFAALCIDHAEVQAMIPRVSDRKIITYGLSPQADVRATNVDMSGEGARFDVVITPRGEGEARTIEGLHFPMLGNHNIQNSLAAVCVGLELGMSDATIRKGLASFSGVKRRFTKTGEVDGITIIDDYAHHPVEIGSVLKAARDAGRGKVHAVVQPHRYTRLRDLFEEFSTCFNDADTVIVADVFEAGEQPIEGIDKDHLAESLISHGHRHVIALENQDALAGVINDIASPGDYVVCCGAGSISAWAYALPDQLNAVKGEK